MTAPRDGPGWVPAAAGLVSLLLVVFVVVPLLIVVVPVAAALGALTAVGVATASLLGGRAPVEVPPDDAVPADAVRGAAGIEPAWRHHLAVQARSDGQQAVADISGVTGRMWDGIEEAREWFFDECDDAPAVLLLGGPFVIGVPWMVGASFTLGALAASLTGGAVLGVAASGVWVVRSGAVAVARMVDRGQLRRRGAGATCTHPGCFGHTRMPAVECGCTRLHLDLEPGPCGVLRRPCSCGALIPTTPSRAAAAALTLCCPWCRSPLPPGAMLDRDVRLAVIGAPGAGKSSVLDAGLTALGASVARSGGTFEPGPQAATARSAATVDTRVSDTVGGRGVTARVSLGRRRAVLTVFDAPGSDLDDGLRRSRLHHLADVHGFALVIDAMALPRIAMLHGGGSGAVDPVLTYRAVVAQLADDRVDLGRRALAVLVHKADLLDIALRGRGPAPGSDGVRTWLRRYGHADLVRAAERDFGTVGYFRTSTQPAGPASAGVPLAWLAGRAGYRMPAVSEEVD